MGKKGNKVVKVIIEDAGTNLSAYIEGAPIITVGDNIQELKANIEEAIELYLEDNPTPCDMLCGDFDLVFEMASAPTALRKTKPAKQKVLQPA
ncbi:MAG: hypothetical protein LUD72_04570 [Bacteroidales bacterium]|nr:hypothetical protein [Bacteroidales bacterium]